ncbi:amidase family protein [Nocardioides sp. Soil805]|uniref:amidase family protein n=1 Tax=Nocardioides sp. Soil805 TaxID=1736416 RepID=UPI000703972A|nr:amidase family protein [Nocardioides sp. Soil805]KRF34146.1 amidase [Nocardioides sp. Soil805]
MVPSPSPAGARAAVEQLLERIDAVEPLVNAICTPHPEALAQADRLDREAGEGAARGPLHGRAVLVKDNVDTHDLPTTAGSLALADAPPPTRDATLVRRLRDAGMVVLGKTNLSEWANIRDEGSTSGWSAYGGLTRNPYALNRSAGGSSSGSGAAVAAGLAPYAVGTETDGSITCPAAFNGCVGIKPTVGTVPTAGVVPVSSSQDSAGAMALTVADAAALLGVLAADGTDYAAYAVPGRLAGKRIGVPRATYWGYSSHADAAAERALSLLAAEGATIVDHTDLPALGEEVWEDELLVLLAELRVEVEAYLATREGTVPRTLREVVDFNSAHAGTELAHFGQALFEQALAGPVAGSPEHLAARGRGVAATRDGGIDRVLREHGLDALVTPSFAPANPIDLVNHESFPGSCTGPSAIAGYPLVTVPTELAAGLPVAVSFWGTAGSEGGLIEVAHGYETARDASSGPLPPPTFPTFV